MWSTQSDRERAAARHLLEQAERAQKLAAIVPGFPDKTISVLLRVDVNPAQAYLDSVFVQEMVDGSQAPNIGYVVTGDVQALLESDDITDSNNVHDVSDAAQIAADSANMLRTLRERGEYVDPKSGEVFTGNRAKLEALFQAEFAFEKLLDRLTLVTYGGK